MRESRALTLTPAGRRGLSRNVRRFAVERPRFGCATSDGIGVDTACAAGFLARDAGRSAAMTIDKTYQPAAVEGRIYAAWEAAGAFRAGRPERAEARALLHRHPAAQRHRLAAHGPRAQQHAAGHPGPLRAHARQGRAVAAGHRPRRHRHADGRRAPADGAPGAGPPRASAARRSSSASGSGRPSPAAPSSTSSSGSAPPATGRANASPWTRACRAPCVKVFVELYREGLIYGQAPGQLGPEAADRDLRPRGRSRSRSRATSGTFKYPIEGSDEFIMVATTRPETMLGDTAVAIHPEDER